MIGVLRVSGEWGAGCHFFTVVFAQCRDTAMRCSLGMDAIRLTRHDCDPNVRAGGFLVPCSTHKVEEIA